MNQLSGLDAAFLALETATSTGHVGGVCVLDPSDAPKPLDLAVLTELFVQRLDLVPVLRQKLLEVPLGLDPLRHPPARRPRARRVLQRHPLLPGRRAGPDGG
ncbi:MAG TPA: wax ester/triacylglycerol synthase domain-containing protein [Pseudonocardia sp.]|nr:wax ester/triacylglycerol synthase domain-containing protein [Pseudonocardia sp.]